MPKTTLLASDCPMSKKGAKRHARCILIPDKLIDYLSFIKVPIFLTTL